MDYDYIKCGDCLELMKELPDGSMVEGKRFKNLRRSKNFTLEQLATELNKQDPTLCINRQTLGRIENGTQYADVKTLKAYCRYFDVLADYLIGISNNYFNELKFISIEKETGLSTAAIETLIKLNGLSFGNSIETLNLLLSDIDKLQYTLVFYNSVFNQQN